ncbi:MAG: transcriptional regulator [Bacillaceae bacterium]|nr:transcriptional regulator [Bacillaceae bacterium]
MDEIPVLKTQFSPPAVKERYVRRANVYQKLRLIPAYPLTLLHSGAGYGKSTALSLFFQDANIQPCWYSITQYDDDFSPFLTKIIYAIRTLHPDFGGRILEELKSIDHYVHDQEIWSLMTMMVNELSSLKEDLALVLDDLHHVDSSSPIESWLQLFIEHLPDHIHLVISSRSRPKWPILTRMKVKGELLEIQQNDLLFGIDEMEHLLVDVYGLSVSKEKLRGIHQTTEGWAIACGMFVEQLRSGERLDAILQMERRSLQDLFDYLAMEVLSKQSPVIQKFLEQTSVLEVISADVCDAILGMRGSDQLLEDLSDQNLFLHAIDDRHYRYHALFKAFLENRLKKDQPDEFVQLHEKAARYYEQKGNMEQAIFHLEQNENHGRAAQLLSKYGLVMLREGKIQSLFERLQQLPESEKDFFPVLWYLEGEILRYRSKYKSSEQCYDRAIQAEQVQHHDVEVKSLAYEGKARIYLDTIQPDKAERILQQAIEFREQMNGSSEDMARLYHMLGENLLNAGHAQKAEGWFNRAKELNLPLDESNLEARLYLRTGRLFKAKKLLLERKESVPLNDAKHLPQTHRETDILLSIIEAFMGNGEESKRYAQMGIELGLKYQAPFVEACGWMRMGHAVQLHNRYETKLAEDCYKTSLDMMEKLNVSRGKAEPYMGLCILYGMQGEYEKAIEAGRKGLFETEKVKDVWLSALIQQCMAIAAIYSKKYDEAKKLLKETKDSFTLCHDDYGLMLSAFWNAYICFELQNWDEFAVWMREFIKKLQVGSYDFFIRQRTTFGPQDMQNMVPMLYKAQEMDIQRNVVMKWLHESGYQNMHHHPGYTLRVKTLGQFRVWLGNREIQETDWQRGKARELFELLVTRRKKMLTKEEIFQCLWPDQNEESANRSFKVALNALLKTLEPERKARAESFFIKREGTAYGLNPASGYELDLEDFEEWVNTGLEEENPAKAKEFLEKGLACYNGEFLPERRVEDWCITERERLEVLFLRGAEKMAQVSVRLNELDTCIHWCQKILEVDPTWEEAYRLLMYSYYQKNNRPQALKWYQKCKDVLKRELGVEPMQPTRDMYHMIR